MNKKLLSQKLRETENKQLSSNRCENVRGNGGIEVFHQPNRGLCELQLAFLAFDFCISNGFHSVLHLRVHMAFLPVASDTIATYVF